MSGCLFVHRLMNVFFFSRLMSGCDRARSRQLEAEGHPSQAGTSPSHHGNQSQTAIHMTYSNESNLPSSLSGPLDIFSTDTSSSNISGSHGNRTVPRDDSGLSIVSGLGRPSDSGYGTDSPASLNTSALQFAYESLEGAEGGDNVDDLDFELFIDDDDDDDVFLNIVQEEEFNDDGDFNSTTDFLHCCDEVDGLRRRSGGSDGQAEPSTEDEDSPTSTGSSTSMPIAIPRPLHTEGLEYSVALAYTPPQSGSSEGRLAVFSPAGAVLFSARNIHDTSGVWSVAQAHLQNPTVNYRLQNPFRVRQAAFFPAIPRRNSLRK